MKRLIGLTPCSLISLLRVVQPATLQLQSLRNVHIQTQETPNPNSLKFLADQQVLGEGKTREFTTKQAAIISPLARKLFRIDGVKSVLFGNDFLTVTKVDDEKVEWSLITPVLFATITKHLDTKLPIIIWELDKEQREAEKAGGGVLMDGEHHPTDESMREEERETVGLIKELLDLRVRPTVEEDGCDVVYMSYEDGIVRLKLRRSGISFPNSILTLKSSIENLLKLYIPEIQGVELANTETEEIAEKEFMEVNMKIEGPESTIQDEIKNPYTNAKSP